MPARAAGPSEPQMPGRRDGSSIEIVAMKALTAMASSQGRGPVFSA